MYESFSQSTPSTFVYFPPFQIPVNSKGYTFSQTTMSKPTSSTAPSVPTASAPAPATLSMFTTSPESYLHGDPMVPLGYTSLFGIFYGASSYPWNLPCHHSVF